MTAVRRSLPPRRIGGRRPPAEPRPLPPGALVLGVHRSGTSVVAGLVDAFGLDGGARATMLSADQFNSDGYWEQRPLVEFHDEVLRQLGGFASAPPPLRRTATPEHMRRAYPIIAELLESFAAPWFLKDPRHCLALEAWSQVLHPNTLHIVVSRAPADVIRSLRNRNGYSRDLATGMWAHYTHRLLRGVDGKACCFVQYEQLLRDPVGVCTTLAGAIERHFPELGPFDDAAVRAAASLVRPPERASSGTVPGSAVAADELPPSVVRLHELVVAQAGYTAAFRCPPLAPLDAAGERSIAVRRALLWFSRFVPRLGSAQRARLDLRRAHRSGAHGG